jgi:hypothetical protein
MKNNYFDQDENALKGLYLNNLDPWKTEFFKNGVDNLRAILIRRKCPSNKHKVYQFDKHHTSLSDIPNNSYCRASSPAKANVEMNPIERRDNKIIPDGKLFIFDDVPAGDPFQFLIFYWGNNLLAYWDMGDITPTGIPFSIDEFPIDFGWEGKE